MDAGKIVTQGAPDYHLGGRTEAPCPTLITRAPVPEAIAQVAQAAIQ